MALAAYRHVLRGINIAFKNDIPLLTQARLQARQDFQAHRDLDGNSHHAKERIQHAEQVAALLRHNVVQGTRSQNGDNEPWHLNIHEQTELGDNESIKHPGKGRNREMEGVCCQDSRAQTR